MQYEFHWQGRVVPYTRMTRRGKFVDRGAQRYLAWKQSFAWELKQRMHAAGWALIPKGVPLVIEIRYWLPGKRAPRFDLSNVIKAVEDACNGIVWDDDRQVEVILASRAWGAAEHHLLLRVGRAII